MVETVKEHAFKNDPHITVFDCVQGTQDWFDLHRGIVTASNVSKILTPKKLKYSDSETADNYACKLAVERFYNYPVDTNELFSNKFTERGHIEEPLALEEYQRVMGIKTKEVGFVTRSFAHAEPRFIIGASPDSHCLTGELIQEVKSVQNHMQFKNLMTGYAQNEHKLQTQAQMLVTGAEECDLVIYSNGMPLFVTRYEYDSLICEAILDACQKLEEKIRGFIEIYANKVAGKTPVERLDYSQLMEIQV